MPEMLTVPEMSARLKISLSHGYKLARRPDFPAVRIGRSLRVPESALAEWLEAERRDQQPAST